MKSRINPGDSLFQIVVADYSFRGNGHRRTWVGNNNDDKKAYKSVDVDLVPHKTLFRFAKNGKRAMRKVGKRFGTIISCQKVDSHHHHLNKIESLNLEPIKIEMTVEDFTINREGFISRSIEIEGREIDIE